eukprot:976-Heterococcus_DN1.PRE.2
MNCTTRLQECQLSHKSNRVREAAQLSTQYDTTATSRVTLAAFMHRSFASLIQTGGYDIACTLLQALYV